METMRADRSRRRPAAAAIPVICLAAVQIVAGCAGGTDLAFEIDPDNPLASSHAAVESLSDSAYVAYLREGLRMVAEGNAWGERLLRFLDEQSRLVPLRRVESTHKDPPGKTFYLAVHPPNPRRPMFYYREEPRALMVPKIPIAQPMAGIILGHELQHAYDAIMQPQVTEKGTTNYAFMELNAYRLAIELANNHTGNAFQAELEKILEEKRYDRKGSYLLYPDRKARARLDALFGPPSPWELGHRTPIYVLGLTFAECENQVERIYATYAFHRRAGIPLPPPGAEWFARPKHAGRDLSSTPGEGIASPIDGKVAGLVEPALPGEKGHGLILEGAGEDEGRTIRILNLSSSLTAGTEVRRGEEIGRAEDPGTYLKGIRPHIHVEVYEQGRRKEAVAFVADRFPDRRETGPVYEGYRFEGSKPLERGFSFEAKREYRNAIEQFEEAQRYPLWEASTSIIYHYIARSHAALGEYEAAAAVQRKLVQRLEMELAYSEGSLPAPQLGLIGTVRDKEALEIWLDHQRRNLNAYEMGLDTLFVY